jgi:tRNA uridine 5-carboxymethylaminomethyl modification enzyme
MAINYDVIIVGGGHAGIEAAYAAARLGSKTLLITLKLDKIGYMPCNPAIGGIGKGHIVFEVAAFGGLMPKLCSTTYLQARMLNTKKGPAVQGLRLQIDKHAYNAGAKAAILATKNLTAVEGAVSEVLFNEQQEVIGIKTEDDTIFHAGTVVLTTGTFLGGKIHYGTHEEQAGRVGERAVSTLSEHLKNLGLEMARLKTGTPPRLLKSSLDFSKMDKQDAEPLNYLFSFYPEKVVNKHDCYITHTNETTHDIIKKNLEHSPIYSGAAGTKLGPRYCPSIEDKVGRFPNKNSHHVFVEPESDSTEEIYPNGISTSLPLKVQEQYIHSIKGFEKAEILQPGYAVAYDFVFPNQLKHTLEVKKLPGLFLAGQINGTTGYEEAAGQGLIAGINAHLKVHGKEPFIFKRTEGYIGIMIDDLVSLGVDEPYRMFTSRAEHRLLLRQDNVFLRLGHMSFALGLIDEKLYKDICQEKALIETTIKELKTNHKSKITQLLGNTDAARELLKELTGNKLSERTIETVWADIRYEPYLAREQKEIEKAEQYQRMLLPAELDIDAIDGLSTELKQKLKKHQPKNIAQALLIPGMTPAAISLLIFKSREAYKLKR